MEDGLLCIQDIENSIETTPVVGQGVMCNGRALVYLDKTVSKEVGDVKKYKVNSEGKFVELLKVRVDPAELGGDHSVEYTSIKINPQTAEIKDPENYPVNAKVADIRKV